MPKFRIKFRDSNGEVYSEVGEYETKLKAIESISDRGLTPLEVKKELGFDANNIILTKTVPKQKSADFLEILSETIGSGLSVTSGTEEAVKYYKTGYLSVVVAKIDADLKKGIPLSDAFEQFPTVFNESDVNLLRSGENTGKTEEVLKKLAENHRKSGDLFKSLIGSLIYPGIILLMAIVVVYVVVAYLVPTVSTMYDELDGELPVPTQMVVAFSNNVTKYYLLYIIGVVIVVIGVIALLKVEQVRYFLDVAVLRLPFFGNLVKNFETYKLCFIISSLLEGGVATNKTLDIASKVVNNRFIAKEIREVKQDIEMNGTALSDAFAKTKHVLPIFLQNISSGEKTGDITEKLGKLSVRLERIVNKKIDIIKKVLSPALIAILAVFVGFLMFAAMSPMYSVMDYM